MIFAIGTTNSDKIKEMAAILTASGSEYRVPEQADPEETGSTFEENAGIKARANAAKSGLITIAEDSGLCIAALCGLPGPWSARFSDCEIDLSSGQVTSHNFSNTPRKEMDLKNCQRVLDLMRGIEEPRRAAAFMVVLVVAAPDGRILFTARAESHGSISEEMRGVNGFGYDPIFIGKDTFPRTYAELDSFRKNLRSHRQKVLQEFKAWLAQHVRQHEGS